MQGPTSYDYGASDRAYGGGHNFRGLATCRCPKGCYRMTPPDGPPVCEGCAGTPYYSRCDCEEGCCDNDAASSDATSETRAPPDQSNTCIPCDGAGINGMTLHPCNCPRGCNNPAFGARRICDGCTNGIYQEHRACDCPPGCCGHFEFDTTSDSDDDETDSNRTALYRPPTSSPGAVQETSLN